MGSSFFIYDPESNPEPSLIVGKSYQADNKGRGQWLLHADGGAEVAVRATDLVNKRDKTAKLAEAAAHVVYEISMLLEAREQSKLRFA